MQNNNLNNGMFEDAFFNLFNMITKDLMPEPQVINKDFSPNGFLKTYLSLSTNLSEKAIDVFIYIMNNVNEEGVFTGNYETIMNDVKISRAPLAEIMLALQQHEMISKHKNGWAVSPSFKMPQKGQNIVIHFGTPKKTINKTNKPDFNLEKFKSFANEYAISYNRLNPNNEKNLNKEEIEKELLEIKEAYDSIDTNCSFEEYIKNSDIESHKYKDEISKLLNTFEKFNNANNYKADLEESSFEKTKQNYMDMIDNFEGLSTDAKFLIKGAMIHILNIAQLINKYDFYTIETLISNPNGYGEKLGMQAEMIARTKHPKNAKYYESIRYYQYRYENSMAHEYLCSLITILKDKYTIIKY